MGPVANVEYVLVLLIAAALLVRVAEFGKVPAPIVLVLGGLGIALLPGVKAIELEPDVIFLVFLPPLVYAAGWRTSPHELRALVRPLALLSVGLVFLTAGVVAVVAHALVPGIGWAGAAVLGAVLAPTDAVSATSIFRRLGAPERVRLLVEGESMINDGTALVIYRIAVGVAAGGAFSAGDAVLEFVVIAAGGVLAGLLVGVLSDLVVRRQSDAGLVIFISVLTAYSAYIGAEQIHVSGILAAVFAGLYAGYQSGRSLDADTRLAAVAFWGVSIFALEITLFVLLGLQLPTIVDALEQSSSGVGELLLPAAAIAVASIGARLAFVFAMRTDAGDTAGQRFAVGWSGMRGAVSLAAALAIPLDVPGRPQIVFLSFALILITLVGQGLLAAVRDPRPRAGGAAALERRGGGGADGGGPGRARPARRDRGRGPRLGVAAAAPARPLPRPLPHVPGGAGWRGPGDGGTPAAARELRGAAPRADRDRARDPAGAARQRPPATGGDAPGRARPRPRGGADPLLSEAYGAKNSRARAATRSGISSAMKWPQPGTNSTSISSAWRS